MSYSPIIGMEVHVELKTKSKMFCSCPNNPDETGPNKNICPVCTAQPGTLPVPNKKAIEWTVFIGKALDCTIRELSKFDRKHYFYPDLPKGYQISQYDEPIAEHGSLTLFFPLEANIRDRAVIHIQRVHLEEDTAKLFHENEGETLVDFNRAGIPLVEIVTQPDFKTPLEAKTYCQELQRIFRTLSVSDANMEKGHMRCEANISVQEDGGFEIVDGVVKPLAERKLNAKVELKNINSFRALERAIRFEIERQTDMLKKGETWEQQTRGWDDDFGETVLQRVKEHAADYRYFPDPDIPPFHPKRFEETLTLPELPQAKRTRFRDEYGFSYADAMMLTETKEWATFAERVMSELTAWLDAMPEIKGNAEEIAEKQRDEMAQLTGGWMTSKLAGILNEKGMNIADVPFSPENFAELVSLIFTHRVNATNGYKILLIMAGSDTNRDPTHILEEKGWGQIEDTARIEAVIDEIIQSYPKQVEEYKNGKEQVLQFLIGMVMRATEGSANPDRTGEILKKKCRS